jgi:hypothetical protein
MPSVVPRPVGVTRAFREELPPGRQTALISWLAFTGTFGVVRLITYSIKDGEGPLRDISVGGVHLHHYLWGILAVSTVGGIAIQGEDPRVRHPALGLGYGSGLALIVDEFALLLDLKDVYWAKQGRASVDLGILLISIGATVFVANPIFRRLVRDRRQR